MAVTAYPTVVFDVANGANAPSASGAGPATALTGTSASTDAAGTVVTLDGSPDLSGVATNGSHVIYLNDTTSGNRRWAAINAVDNTAKTVTVEQAYAASLSGLSWAIGGELASINDDSARLLWRNSGDGDAAANWQFELQATGTYQMDGAWHLTIAIYGGYRFFGTGGQAHIDLNRGRIATADGGNGYVDAIKIDASTSSTDRKTLIFENLHFESTGTVLQAIIGGFLKAGTRLIVNNCRFTSTNSSPNPDASFDEQAMRLTGQNARQRVAFIDNCHFVNFQNVAIMTSGNPGSSGFAMTNCFVEGCSNILNQGQGRPYGTVIRNNIFKQCGQPTTAAHGKRCTLNLTVNGTYGQRGWFVENNVFYQSVGDDININTVSSDNIIRNNISYEAGGNFLRCDSAIGPNLGGQVDYNIVYSPTSSKFNSNIDNARSLWGANDITTDPGFTDAANNDFSVGSSSPAKAAGYPTTNLGSAQSSTRSYVDIGAAQREETGGGGADAVLVSQGLHSIDAGITA